MDEQEGVRFGKDLPLRLAGRWERLAKLMMLLFEYEIATRFAKATPQQILAAVLLKVEQRSRDPTAQFREGE